MCFLIQQENIEQHQAELSNVLKEGKTDVQEKQKQIKLLRHEVDDLTSTKSDLESQVLIKYVTMSANGCIVWHCKF